MRNKLLVTVTLLATLISPTVTVAEPATLAKKNVEDNTVVENVKVTMNSQVGETKEEIATHEIEQNLQKIEDAKNAQEAAAKAAADRASSARVQAQRTVAIYAVATGDNSDAIAYGRARNAAVFGEVYWPALFSLWSKESGWRDTAYNRSSGACGIPQFISGCVIGDHVSQIDRGLVYIKNRYGTPANAWNFWQAHHWY